MSDEAKIVVEFQNVGVQYPNGVWALDDVTLKVCAGDLVCLIGPNGAGKSTLLSVILGLVKPNNGSVKLFGKPVTPESLRNVGYVPQRAYVADASFPSTVFETVLLGRVPRKGLLHRFGQEDREKVEEVLNLLDIYELRDRKIGELSGGQTQRIFVAKALAGEPKFLIFDEPTSEVDVHSKDEFYEMLKRLNRELGITIMLSTHEVSIVTELATRVVCINKSLYFCGLRSEFDASSVFPRAYGYGFEVVKHGKHP
jgi:zinc transport system ATP-binding protein